MRGTGAQSHRKETNGSESLPRGTGARSPRKACGPRGAQPRLPVKERQPSVASRSRARLTGRGILGVDATMIRDQAVWSKLWTLRFHEHASPMSYAWR